MIAAAGLFVAALGFAAVAATAVWALAWAAVTLKDRCS